MKTLTGFNLLHGTILFCLVLLQIDLTGGYYDAGDNIKFGFPMAFTTTIMAWVAIEYEAHLSIAGQLSYVRDAIKWGTDYFLKAHTKPDELYVQVYSALLPDYTHYVTKSVTQYSTYTSTLEYSMYTSTVLAAG